MDGQETAVLKCSSCGLEAEHDLRYAGRLLVSSVCGNCGFTWHHSDSDLRSAYVHDLEARIRTKPHRWFRRLQRHPVETALELPRALLIQPIKLAREIATILRG